MSENFERIVFLRLLHRIPARNLIVKKDRHAAVVRFAKLCVVEREREIAIVIVIVFARVDAQRLRRIVGGQSERQAEAIDEETAGEASNSAGSIDGPAAEAAGGDSDSKTPTESTPFTSSLDRVCNFESIYR